MWLVVAVVCVAKFWRHVRDMCVVMDNVGVVWWQTLAIAGHHRASLDMAIAVPVGARLLLVRILLDLRHRVDLPVIKRFKVASARLHVVREMQISRRIVSDSGGKCVVRMMTRHLTTRHMGLEIRTKMFSLCWKIFEALTWCCCVMWAGRVLKLETFWDWDWGGGGPLQFPPPPPLLKFWGGTWPKLPVDTAEDWDRSISRGSLGTPVVPCPPAVPLSVKDVSLMFVHRPYGSSCSVWLSTGAGGRWRGLAPVFMAIICSWCMAASSSVGGAQPLWRLKLFHPAPGGGLCSLWRLTLSKDVDFLWTAAGSTSWWPGTAVTGPGTVCPGGEVELVVLELSGRPESKLLLLRASWSEGVMWYLDNF